MSSEESSTSNAPGAGSVRSDGCSCLVILLFVLVFSVLCPSLKFHGRSFSALGSALRSVLGSALALAIGSVGLPSFIKKKSTFHHFFSYCKHICREDLSSDFVRNVHS